VSRRRRKGRFVREGAPNPHLRLRQTEIVHYSGPIPTPAMLRAYGEVIEDGAERVFRMAEEQGRHRRKRESLDLLLQLLGLLLGRRFVAGLGTEVGSLPEKAKACSASQR
jgi:hypothetical protein